MYRKLNTIIISIISMAAISIHTVQAEETSGTISVVSFDGLGYMDAQRYMDKGILRNLQDFKQQAAYASDFVTVTPSLTAPSHATMATGAAPAETGIVSNQFHTAGEKVKDDQSGFSQTLGVTPIWKEARSQGKVTATVAFPNSNPENVSAATYAVYSGGTLADAKLHDLKFTVVEEERVNELSAKAIEYEEAVVTLDIKDSPSQQLFIVRTEEEEPKLYISTEEQELGKEVHIDEWFDIILDLPSLDSAGFYVKLKGNLEEKEGLQLFQGTVMGGIYDGPDDFSEQIESQFGFYPVADELQAFIDGDITREEYEQTGERFAGWVTDVSLHIKEQYRPDLLFYYYPIVDNELHEFLLRDPAQPGYEIANVLKNESYVSWAFAQADQAIERITEDLHAEDHLFIVSDHGLGPIHTRLSPNKELEKAGLLVKDAEGAIDTSKTKAYAEASGTVAHVYVNLKGRETKGIVEEKEFEQVKQQIVSVFTNRTVYTALSQDPRDVAHPILRWLTGKSERAYTYPSTSIVSSTKGQEVTPYESVWTDDDEEYATFNNENSGDVFLSAAPGFLMGKDAEITVEPTQELGSHGGDPERMELRPILFAAGPNIPQGELTDRLTMADIAPSLYELLDLQAPAFVEGKVIWETK